MNVDLDVLKGLAEAATPGPWIVTEHTDLDEFYGDWHKVGPFNMIGGDADKDDAFIAAANPAVVLDLLATIARLNSNVAILSAQSEALHLVGHALGLPAGADVTVDVLPAVRALRDSARAVVAELDERSSQAPGHCHTIPGRWDASNRPEIAGKPCQWCATWSSFKALVGSAP